MRSPASAMSSSKALQWIPYVWTRQRLKPDTCISILNKQTGSGSGRCFLTGTSGSGFVQASVRTIHILRSCHSASQLKSSLENNRRLISDTPKLVTGLSTVDELSGSQLAVSELSTSPPSRAWKDEAALYVHWPYCQRRCTYCNFNKYISNSVDHSKMQQCLVREARTLIGVSGIKRVTSVFFGGGTPSLAKPRTLEAVLEAVSKLVDVPSNAEITMEGNPTSVGLSKLRDFKAAGINRVSLGIQALNDDDLRLLGRDHTSAESIQCIEEAKRLFPGRSSLDLIFGRSGQTLQSWQEELEQVLTLCDNHVSLYQLTLERGTALFKMQESGLLDLPDEDVVADMYDLAVEVMAGAGLNRYEVSNFAKRGSESKHNQAYWEGGQYIGIGPGAHGRFIVKNSQEITDSGQKSLREARIQTLEPDPWMYEVTKYGHGTRKRVHQSQLDVLQELLATSMRTHKGITHERWSELSDGGRLSDVFKGERISDLQRAGLIEGYSAGFRATPKGMALLDSFIPDLLIAVQNWYKQDRSCKIKS